MSNSTRVLTVHTGRPFAGSSQWGYRARVEADGTVGVYDDVAGHYTTCHSLTPQQIAHVRTQAVSDDADDIIGTRDMIEIGDSAYEYWGSDATGRTTRVDRAFLLGSRTA